MRIVYIEKRDNGKVVIEDDYEELDIMCPVCAHIHKLIRLPKEDVMRSKYGKEYKHGGHHMYQEGVFRCDVETCSTSISLPSKDKYDYRNAPDGRVFELKNIFIYSLGFFKITEADLAEAKMILNITQQ